MKKTVFLMFVLFAVLLSACSNPSAQWDEFTEQTEPTTETTSVTIPATVTTQPTEPETSAPPAEPVILLTEEEQTMLLKLGMAERGSTECTQCIALVMRSVLNRVEAGHFRSIRNTILAEGQYLPVWDGTYETAQPNDCCYEALDMVIYGWDESQGALFYEWCEGESWHSKNLHLLFQHCDTRFYD